MPQNEGLVEMKRLVIGAVLAAGMVMAVKMVAGGAGPTVGERCSEVCDRFLDNMPDSFPPNRMMADLEEIKERTTRILEVLEEREDVDGSPE